MLSKKEGYEAYRVMVIQLGSNDIKLRANLEESKNITMARQFDSTMDGVLEGHRLIRLKNYNEAIKRLSHLERKHPNFSTIYETKGSAYYLKKDFNKSLASYRKAFSVNPKNYDAYTMLNYLEKSLGLKNKR